MMMARRGHLRPGRELAGVMGSQQFASKSVVGRTVGRTVGLDLDQPVEVDRPGLNVVVHGSTSAMPSSPRVIALSSLACLPDEPRKMRGLLMMTELRRA
jgi:hypothetical protein